MAKRRIAKSKCVVLVPVSHHIEPATQKALSCLEAAGYTVWRVYGLSDIARGRSKLASAALDAGFEQLMWIDADVVFDPDAVDRLRAHGLPMVCGIYPAKAARRLTCATLGEEPEFVFGEGGGLVELRYAATGFLLTHRSVYERVREHHRLPTCTDGDERLWPFFLSLVVPTDDGSHAYLSEDFSFSHRVREAGFQVMADTTIRLGHVGSYVYSWEDAGMALRRVPSYRLRMCKRIEPDPSSAA
ncbi:MAG: hypothetical protein U0168_14540 [Nannocystaceae bacterium]|jgi:hypothetical protein